MCKETCSECRFWVIMENKHKQPTVNTGGVLGLCKRYPPVVNVEVQTYDTTEIGGGNSFVCVSDDYLEHSSVSPVTVSSNWCGEFKQKAGED